MTARSLAVVLWIGVFAAVPLHASEHLLFHSTLQVDCESHYRILLSLHLHENRGEWEVFEVRRVIETTNREHTRTYSREETSCALPFGELISLGHKGFALLTVPHTMINVLYLKVIDPASPKSTLGLSYPIDARPSRRRWGWFPLRIAGEGSMMHPVDAAGMPFQAIEMQVDYRSYWGIKPVGLSIFRPVPLVD